MHVQINNLVWQVSQNLSFCTLFSPFKFNIWLAFDKVSCVVHKELSHYGGQVRVLQVRRQKIAELEKKIMEPAKNSCAESIWSLKGMTALVTGGTKGIG